MIVAAFRRGRRAQFDVFVEVDVVTLSTVEEILLGLPIFREAAAAELRREIGIKDLTGDDD